MLLFERIIAARGLDDETKADFLSPKYEQQHDPFLLPDMNDAVKRLVKAHKNNDKIIIYGDYDIDGLTAAALVSDAFVSFGFKNFDIFIPNRFEEGYGLTVDAIEEFAKDDVNLILTVDCGSTSAKEVKRANELGIDVIITDHHTSSDISVPALAVINPKLKKSKYPFKDIAGVGVAFKLVRAMQKKLKGLPEGQEKWLLDLVAIGTVCDVVALIDENRTNVYWGLKVLSQTKRPGLKALMAISNINPENIDTRLIGFRLGPRMNAAGRLETAEHSLKLLTSNNPMEALEAAEYLDDLNKLRRQQQDKIFKQAIVQADKFLDDSVLVVSSPDWNHGIVGIVASKLMEKYKKPVFVLQEIGTKTKGSARSFGDFSAVDAINHVKYLISKGGGHRFAAGLTLPTKNIAKFRKSVNEFYKELDLKNQKELLLPTADATAELDEVDEELVLKINQMEPFGIGNPQPVIKCENLMVSEIRKMGEAGQHVKLDLNDNSGGCMQFLSFNAPKSYYVKVGDRVSVCFSPNINEWRGNRSIEGQISHIEVS